MSWWSLDGGRDFLANRNGPLQWTAEQYFSSLPSCLGEKLRMKAEQLHRSGLLLILGQEPISLLFMRRTKIFLSYALGSICRRKGGSYDSHTYALASPQ